MSNLNAQPDARQYRDIPLGEGLCSVCDKTHSLIDHPTAPSFVNEYGVRQKPRVLPVHGPRKARCTGSHEAPVPWLEASRLPAWDELTDLDKGAALMHVWKRYWENDGIYARENYPAEYFDHPVLTGLDYKVASRHAAVVAGAWRKAVDRLGSDETQRLYDLALAADRARSGGRS